MLQTYGNVGVPLETESHEAQQKTNKKKRDLFSIAGNDVLRANL